MNVSDAHKQQYETQGFFITPPLFEGAFTAEVSAEFDRLWIRETERTGGPMQDRQGPDEPGFMIMIAKRSAIIAEIFRQPAFLDVVAGMLGPDADLNYDQIVMKQPQASGAHAYEFAFHQDNYYALRGQDPENWDEAIHLDIRRTFQGWMAFSETTLENGTLFVMPGAHRFGLLEHVPGRGGHDCSLDARIAGIEKTPVCLKPGQLLVFSGLLPHGSGLNRTAAARKVLQFSVSVPGGRPPRFARPLLRAGHAG